MGNNDQRKQKKIHLFKNVSLKQSELVLGIGSLLLLFGPLLLSQPWGLGGFSETAGHVGDAIGGITAPITGLIGSILVYFALKAQIEANEQIQSQIENQEAEAEQQKKVQYIKDDITVLRKDLDDFRYILPPISNLGSPEEFSGWKGIERMFYWYGFNGHPTHYEWQIEKHPYLLQLNSIMVMLGLLINKIDNQIENDVDKNYLKASIDLLVSTRLTPAFSQHPFARTGNEEACVHCMEVHIAPHRDLFKLYDQLRNDTAGTASGALW